jgi:hypothetical protein
MRVYVQTGPTTWAFVTQTEPPKRGELPLPYVISDIMEPTEQVDGNFYTSKRAFRAVGRSLGLTEVGNEKFKPKLRSTDLQETKIRRRQSLKTAIEKYKAGHRPAGVPPVT